MDAISFKKGVSLHTLIHPSAIVLLLLKCSEHDLFLASSNIYISFFYFLFLIILWLIFYFLFFFFTFFLIFCTHIKN